jgi:amino acid adenylation domain-containing protein
MGPEDRSKLCLATQVLAVAARTPEKVALRYDGCDMSYGTLAQQAGRVAAHLRQSGVSQGDLVGICQERSPDLIVGILAILICGAAYVPLDPTYPADRLAYILEAADIRVVLADMLGSTVLAGFTGQVLDTAHIAETGQTEELAPSARSSDLAYVIFTSGSTGRPKGVMVTHHNVSRLFSETEAWFAFDQTDTWTLFHSVCFDFSVWEIFGALLYGGTLVIVPYWISRDPEAFVDLVIREQVSVLNQTPTAFKQFLSAVQYEPDDMPAALRWIIFGGEPLPTSAVQRWYDLVPSDAPALMNMYGITETTVHVTGYKINRAKPIQTSTVPIGQAIPDLQFYVLDDDKRPVGDGETGMLYVSGDGLARGYLNNPALTNERFQQHPDGTRLYWSGDLAQVSNGAITITGRADQQAKVRGHRVDLNEVEDALRRATGLSSTAALVSGDGSALLGFYVTEAGWSPRQQSDIFAELSQHLPGHAVPSNLIALNALPLTDNGKLDKPALVELARTRASNDEPIEPPKTPIETAIAASYCSVLELAEVGRRQNFFTLGGDSIRAVALRDTLARQGLSVRLEDTFAAATVADLALRVTENTAPPETYLAFSQITQETRANLPATVVDAWPANAMQAGMIFHAMADPFAEAYHNVTRVRLKAPVDPDLLARKLGDLMQAETALRSSFDLSSAREPIQLVHDWLEVPLEVVDLRGMGEVEQDRALNAHFAQTKHTPLDPTCPPLFRLVVHWLAEQRMQVTLIEHHAILDGWSVSMLLSRLFGSYLAALGFVPDTGPVAASDHPKRGEDILAEESMAFWRDQAARHAPTFLTN